MKKVAAVIAPEVTVQTEEKENLVGKRVLANNGTAVVITGDGKCKKVYPAVEDINVNDLNKQSLATNNKLLFEKIASEIEGATSKKGWITVKGFKLRFAPAGFEMYDVENHMTPINLGETPLVDEVINFIKKPSVKKLTENRKKEKVAKPAAVAPKEEVAPVVELTEEEQRQAALKHLQTYARKDVRFVAEMKSTLHTTMTNRKYRVQVGKMFKDFLHFRPVTQKKNYANFVKSLREHLKGFDFTPAPVKAPKFTGLEELDYAKGVVNNEDGTVTYKTAAGKSITCPLAKFLAHDILYNWADYYVAIMYAARGIKSVAEMIETGLVIKDPFCEFDPKLIAVNGNELMEVLFAIYEWQEEVSPLEFVWDNKTAKVGDKIKVYWADLKTSYSGVVKNLSPLEVAYEFGELMQVLKHQKVTLI